MADNIEESIAHWAALAEEEERGASTGLALCPQAAKARADTYRRTAEALRLELQTGKPHCTCCLKPRR